jgi:cbb3-type cytochrome oxidase maturation protein
LLSGTFGSVKKPPFMSVIIVLIGVSITVAVSFLAAFLWAVKSGQFEDDYTPSVRILFDDEKINSETTDKQL